MIDQPTIDRILDAAQIVDIVSDFVTLRKRGVNYVGLCPFHDDKTPSFYVSPSKGLCKCFSCGKGGNAVHFIMEHEQMSYPEALKYLAKKYGIEIKERELSNEEKLVQGERESLFIVNQFARDYFQDILRNHVDGRSIGMAYFRNRGFRDDIIEKFQLGYCTESHDAMAQEALKKGYKKEFLIKTGLCYETDDHRLRDRFWGRVIFPVHTLSGKVVAFGGRVLASATKGVKVKYVNSPESEIYHKSNELYGIYFAKQAIVKQDRCFLVEGYTDVISMHQSGIENVVASSGTALTPGQIRLIHRFTNNMTVLYDGDAAGIKAALRGIDLLLEDGMNVKVVLLPDGEDPDSFARKHNASQFAEFIRQNETDFIRFKTRLLLDDAGTDPIKRSALISDIIRTVAIIPDNIARSLYIRECSTMMEIDEMLLLNEVNKIRLNKEERQANTPSSPIPATPVNIPEYPDIPGYQPYPEETLAEQPQESPLPPDNTIPPPPPEEYSPDDGGGSMLPPAPFTPPAHIPVGPKRSPYEAYEVALLRYIVRYGERILFQYTDEETNEDVVIRVSEYIRSELERDDLTFYTPLFKSMMDEAADRCRSEGFIANRYFLAHPDPNVSRLAANLISEKYQLSKYHTKYRELEQEEDKLDQLVIRELYAFKDAYILSQIKEIQAQIKSMQNNGDMEQVFELMKKLTRLNEIKNVLSKELGERIILKM